MSKLFSGGTTEKLKASNQLFITHKKPIIMSTFHKTTFAAYKIKNALIAQQADKDVLEQILHHLRKMSTEAILLEQLVLAKLPKFSLKTESNEQVFFSTFIIALQGIIERELLLREIYEHDLFSDKK